MYTKSVELTKTQKYRRKNLEKMRLWEKNRYWAKRKQERRVKEFGDRRCKMCEILLSTPVHGAKGTVLYCTTCSSNRKLIRKLYMREYRKKVKRMLKQKQ